MNTFTHTHIDTVHFHYLQRQVHDAHQKRTEHSHPLTKPNSNTVKPKDMRSHKHKDFQSPRRLGPPLAQRLT